MEAKIEKINEFSKLLSVKNRMSDDLFHLICACCVSMVNHLSLVLWRNVTQRDGEYGGISKQALVVTEAPSVRGATEIVCHFF